MTDEADPKPAAEPHYRLPHTLEDKRAYAKSYLDAMADSERRSALFHDTTAAKHRALAAYVEHRSSIVESIPEHELDLMIADWSAALAQHKARSGYRDHHEMHTYAAAYDLGVPALVWRKVATKEEP